VINPATALCDGGKEQGHASPTVSTRQPPNLNPSPTRTTFTRPPLPIPSDAGPTLSARIAPAFRGRAVGIIGARATRWAGLTHAQSNRVSAA
jgi:hypothetical protein